MNDLLQLAITAHGGLEKWKTFKTLKIHLHIGGYVWVAKGKPDVFKDVHYHLDLHKQQAGFTDYPEVGQFTTFAPGRISIETTDGQVLQESINPRATFAGHVWATPWDLLQMIYFSHYAFWTYLTLPFNFTMPGYETEEIEPWQEGDETWRRLRVTFPDYIETHNKTQVFYFDKNGFQKRYDYEPDIMGGFPSTQIVSDYKEFSGIMMPTKRRIYTRNPDLGYNLEPVLVTVDVESAELE